MAAALDHLKKYREGSSDENNEEGAGATGGRDGGEGTGVEIDGTVARPMGTSETIGVQGKAGSIPCPSHC